MTARQFSHPRLAEIERYLDETRRELIRAAHDFPAAHWTDAPADGAWSAAHIIDHLRVVEHGIVRLFQKLVPAARAEGLARDDAVGSVLDRDLVEHLRDRTRRIEAPPRVVPVNTPGRDEGLASLVAERAALLAAVADADGFALDRLSWDHPILGTLNLYQWLVFVGAHEARHTAQLREVANRFGRA